ncbi:MAG TPA: hypothetical protein DCE56_37845 [Cyanobacteria bacterium UBA8553]|nr:hypothetical protein [Cyanobacteria bacterium UBA8553]
MSRSSGEQELISNKFGTISDRQVIFLSNKSLFSSRAREEIPLRQIISVRFYKQKFLLAGIAGVIGLLLPFLLIIFFPGNIIAATGGLLILAFGVWMIYLGVSGIPTVAITTTGDKVTQSSGWPNDKNEAKAFALVLREKLK